MPLHIDLACNRGNTINQTSVEVRPNLHSRRKLLLICTTVYKLDISTYRVREVKPNTLQESLP